MSNTATAEPIAPAAGDTLAASIERLRRAEDALVASFYRAPECEEEDEPTVGELAEVAMHPLSAGQMLAAA